MIDALAYQKFARSVAKDAGLTVTYEEGQNMPRTDGRRLYMPRPNPLWEKVQFDTWLDSAYHEIGHNFPENRDIFPALKRLQLQAGSLFGIVLNIVDDYRVDASRIDAYPGMREPMVTAIHSHATRLADSAASAPSMDEGRDIILAMMSFDIYCRGNYHPALRGLDALLASTLPAHAVVWFDKLCDNYADEYVSLTTAPEEVEFTRKILKEVFDIPPDDSGDTGNDPSNDSEPSNDGEQSEDESDGNASESNESSDDGEPSSTAASSTGEEGSEEGEEKSAGKYTVVKYEDILRHPHFESDIESSHHVVKVLYDDSEATRFYSPHTDTTNIILDYSSGESGYNSTYRPFPREVIDETIASVPIATIVGQARRLLQVETRKRPHFNQKRGRLDATKLYRVTNPHSSLCEKVFKTKEQSQALDTAVSVLVDYSGSMVGAKKIAIAIASAVALSSLFNTLRVSHEIAGFSEFREDKNFHMLFKPFGKNVRESDLVEGMFTATNTMSNNADGDNILIAYNRLVRQKEPRKILIVLSDGSPAGYNGDVYSFTKETIRKIESERYIDILGIGICDDNVERLYKTSKVIEDVATLPESLVSCLENILLERKL